jgi:hypothetical protein
VIGPARHPLGQEALGSFQVSGSKARLQQRVVEDLALGAAAADLDETGP